MRRRARGSSPGIPSDGAGIDVDPELAGQVAPAPREPERLLRALRMARARRLAIADGLAPTRSR